MTGWSCAACLAVMAGLLLVAAPASAQDSVTTVIVDTDAGPDDFMALAFLLSSSRVAVEIRQDAPEEGRTVIVFRGQANAEVALEANSHRFVDLFTRTLGVTIRP